MRHNRVRDLEASLMKEVCHNVQIEPELLSIESEQHTTRGNVAEKARLDVAGVGVWGAYEKTFLDIRIMHPNSPSYVNKPIKDVYELHENEKKRTYNERVLQIEKGSFTPNSWLDIRWMGKGGNTTSSEDCHTYSSEEERGVRRCH